MEHTAKGNPKILKKCRLPYTAVHCITKIITEMCVINVTDKGLELVGDQPPSSLWRQGTGRHRKPP